MKNDVPKFDYLLSSQKLLCIMQKKRVVKTDAQLAYHIGLCMRRFETEYLLLRMCFYLVTTWFD